MVNFACIASAAGGAWITSWGSKGSAPGAVRAAPQRRHRYRGACAGLRPGEQPHSNLRSDGHYLAQWDGRRWPGIQWPNETFITADGTIYLSEAGYRISVWKHYFSPDPSPIWSPRGDYDLLARFGDYGDAPGQFISCPHAICVDSQGSIYVAEVPTHPDRIQKFERV